MKHEVSTLEQKIQWLLEHRNFLSGKADKRKIILAMKHDGLIAKSTYWLDVKIVDEALRQAKFKWSRERLADAISQENSLNVCARHPTGTVYFDGPTCPACQAAREWLEMTKALELDQKKLEDLGAFDEPKPVERKRKDQ